MPRQRGDVVMLGNGACRDQRAICTDADFARTTLGFRDDADRQQMTDTIKFRKWRERLTDAKAWRVGIATRGIDTHRIDNSISQANGGLTDDLRNHAAPPNATPHKTHLFGYSLPRRFSGHNC